MKSSQPAIEVSFVDDHETKLINHRNLFRRGNDPMTTRRRGPLLVCSIMVATFLSSCSIIPWESPLSSGGVATRADQVGPDDTPEFVGGIVEREIQVGVPAGGLEGAIEGELTVGLRTSTPAPFPDVQFTIGDPINEKGNRQ